MFGRCPRRDSQPLARLAGSEVTLRAGDIVSSVVTDESGEANFRKVALAALADATLTVGAAR